ncbi:porin family protein [Sunxiuqinia elliptica]
MNRILSLLVVFILCASVAYGQTSRFKFGLELGPSLASLSGNDFIDDYHDSRLGFIVGPSLEYRLSDLLSVKTALAFERKGSMIKSEVLTLDEKSFEEYKARMNFDYLTMPLLAKLTVGNTTHFFANAGPSFGYLIQQKTITEAFGGMPKHTVDESEGFQKINIGLVLGLGAEHPVNERLSLSVELRSDYGLSNISKLPMRDDGRIATRSIHFLAGLTYKLKK